MEALAVTNSVIKMTLALDQRLGWPLPALASLGQLWLPLASLG